MANEKVILRRGPHSSIPQTKVPGTILVETDTGNVFVDDTTAQDGRVQLSGKYAQYDLNDKPLVDKVDKVQGKDLSTNDYTNDDKEKLAGIQAGATKTIVDSEMSNTSENPVQNKVVSKAINATVQSAILTIPNSDWNESDTSSKAYIKNRTHYKEISTETLISSHMCSSGSMISYDDSSLTINGEVYRKATPDITIIAPSTGIHVGDIFHYYITFIFDNGNPTTLSANDAKIASFTQTSKLDDGSIVSNSVTGLQITTDHGNVYVTIKAGTAVANLFFTYSGTCQAIIGNITKQNAPTYNKLDKNYIPSDIQAASLATPVYIDGVEFDGSKDISRFAVCESAADASEKVCTIPGVPSLNIKTGTIIAVLFKNGNSYTGDNLLLTVGNRARPIYYGNTKLSGNKAILGPNQVLNLVYRTKWHLMGALSESVDLSNIKIDDGSLD